MNKLVLIMATFFTLSTFAIDRDGSPSCDNSIIETPLQLSLVTFIENVDSILPLRNFAVVIFNKTTGETLSSITNGNGVAKYKRYKPQRSNEYVLKVYKTWDWINQNDSALLCSTKLNSEALVDIHKSQTDSLDLHFPRSELQLTLDIENLVTDEKKCKFRNLKRQIYEYRKLQICEYAMNEKAQTKQLRKHGDLPRIEIKIHTSLSYDE